MLREGPGALASSYVRGSSVPPAPPSSATLTPTPTSLSEPPLFLVRRSAFPAARPVIIVRAEPRAARACGPAPVATLGTPVAGSGASPSNASGSGRAAIPKRWARRLPWTAFAGFALGASLACVTGIFTDAGSVGLAACASLLAGSVTLSVALARQP